MADGMTIDVYRRIFVFLLIFFEIHTGRRRLYTDEALFELLLLTVVQKAWSLYARALAIWAKVMETESKQKLLHTRGYRSRCIWAGGNHFRSRKTTSDRDNHFRFDGNRKCRLSSQVNNAIASELQKSTPGDLRRRIFTSR